MKNQFIKKILGAVLAGVMAVSVIPATVVSAASDSTVISNSKNGIYNATLYRNVLNQYDANKDGKLTVGEAKKVTSLNITNQKVTSLKGIHNLPNLTSLTIQNCGISSIHTDLGKLTKLQHLNLSYNKIASLSTNAVKNLKNLVTVDLSGNKLTALPTATKNWTKLTSLDLSGNAIVQIPVGSIPYMKNLTVLDFSDNKMTNSNATVRGKMNKLSNLTKLTKLDLSGNKLTQFPSAAIYKLTNLKELYIDNNQINSITSYIGYLTKLTVLDASDNKISSVSTGIKKCTNLTELDLSNNSLSKIPSLKGLKKLKCTATNLYALNLCGNNLSQTTVRNYTNTVLDDAWVKRQTKEKFVEITGFKPQITFAISGYDTDMSYQFSFDPENATCKTVKYTVESVSAGAKASMNGSVLSVEKTDPTVDNCYVFIKITALDGSGVQDLLYVQVI